MVTSGIHAGECAGPPQKSLKGRGYQINARTSGVWRPAITEGEIVEAGALLGTLIDYFGNVLEEYRAPERSLVLCHWNSPAINAERRPRGYDWHNGLVRLMELDE